MSNWMISIQPLCHFQTTAPESSSSHSQTCPFLVFSLIWINHLFVHLRIISSIQLLKPNIMASWHLSFLFVSHLQSKSCWCDLQVILQSPRPQLLVHLDGGHSISTHLFPLSHALMPVVFSPPKDHSSSLKITKQQKTIQNSQNHVILLYSTKWFSCILFHSKYNPKFSSCLKGSSQSDPKLLYNLIFSYSFFLLPQLQNSLSY